MQQIDRDIYALEDRVGFAGVQLALRTTVLKLSDGGLWVHSPTRLLDGVREQVEALGEVRYLVAASNGHNRWLCDWHEAFPNAAIYVARGIPKKLPKLTRYTLLEDAPDPPWAAELDHAFIGVPFFGEFVFFHKTSRSLIVTDFVQNHTDSKQSGFGALLGKCIFEPMGFKGICVAPPLKTRLFVKDPSALRAFTDKVLSWDFERIIVAHGPIIEANAKAALTALLPKLAM